MKINSFFLITLLLIVFQGQAQKPKVHINHTAIFVIDINASGQFYSNIIGLDTVPEPFHDGKHIWYSTGTHTMLHVIAGATAKKENYKNNFVIFLNGFAVGLKDSFNWVLGKKNKARKRSKVEAMRNQKIFFIIIDFKVNNALKTGSPVCCLQRKC